jgi:hypothetical protein
VAKEYLSFPFVFLWSQVGDQYEFESQFPLGASFPALLTVLPKKKRYSNMRMGGGFDVVNVKGYISRLLAGKESSGDLPAPLSTLNKATKWTPKSEDD